MPSASATLPTGDVWRCCSNDSPRQHCETRLDGSEEDDRVLRYSALILHELGELPFDVVLINIWSQGIGLIVAKGTGCNIIPVDAEAHYVSAFPQSSTVFCYGVPVGGVGPG